MTTKNKPRSMDLSDLYYHATYYRRPKDWIINSMQRYPKGEFKREYAQWRVWARSGLPIEEQYLSEPAVRVLISRGFFKQTKGE